MAIENEDPQPSLSEFLRSRRDDLVAMWMERVRALSPAQDISNPGIIDHVPQILARLATAVGSSAPVSLVEGPRAHAVDRLARGFDLREVVREYSVLRYCILDLWEQLTGGPIDVTEAMRVHLAIDEAIEESTVRFTSARERTLRALDRISEAALGTDDLDGFLRRLLQATLETSDAVDSAVVYLRDGAWLRARAAVGRERDPALDVPVKIGEGIAGTIASTHEPSSLRDAEDGIRALYGVPMMQNGECIGVAQIGSATAYEFSEEDKLLFRTMASRAAGVIVQAELVHDLAQREMTLRGAEERLRLATEVTEIGTWDLNLTTGEAQWSPEMKRLFGSDFQPPVGWSLELINPDDRPTVERMLALSYDATSDGNFAAEYRVRIAEDDERWVVSRGRTFFDEEGRAARMVGTTLDITARKQAEMASKFLSDASVALASSLDSMKTLREVCRLAVPRLADWAVATLVERDGRLVDVAIAHSDPSKTELVTKLRRRHPPNPDATVGVPAVIRSGRPELVRELDDEQLERIAPDEEQRRIARTLGLTSYLIVPLVVRERVIGAITLALAESARRLGEVDLETAIELGRRAAIAVDNARLYEGAREATRLREQVLAIVSHDLRNPLNAIQLALSLLSTKLSESAGQSVERQVRTIARSVERMEHLINDLLDVASIQAGRLAVTLRSTPIARLLEEAVVNHDAAAGQKRVSLSYEQPLPDVRVRADFERIEQVLGNLISNAIKFCREGESVVLGAKVDEREVVFTVRDTGPGISSEELEHLFEPYWSSARHARTGTGLGLYISRGIVGAHGGRIWVESVVGVGSTFFFTVPLA